MRPAAFTESFREPDANRYSQVQRLGNPLINELIIGIGTKDYWSMSKPVNDSQFASFDLDPTIVSIIDSLYSVFAPGALNSPPAPRTDLLPLVEYLPPIAATGTAAGPVADLLRLNTGVAPTDPSKAKPSRFACGRRSRLSEWQATGRRRGGHHFARCSRRRPRRQQVRLHAHDCLQRFSK